MSTEMASSNEDALEIPSSIPVSSLKDKPGNANVFHSFFCYRGDEIATAAYVGYDNTSYLRVLALSWPTLQAAAELDLMGSGLRVHRALKLLQNNAEQFAVVTLPSATWPSLDSDSLAESRSKKDKRVAAILAGMILNLEDMKNFPVQHNDTLQAQSRLVVSCSSHRLADWNLPKIDDPVKAPILGPLAGESAIEPRNRCWIILQYLRQSVHRGLCRSRLSADSINTGFPVPESQKSAWMRPRGKLDADSRVGDDVGDTEITQDLTNNHGLPSTSPAERLSAQNARRLENRRTSSKTTRKSAQAPAAELPESEPPTSEIATLNASDIASDLPSRSFSIIWDHSIEPDHTKPALKAALLSAKSQGVSIPSELQVLNTDPRDMADISALCRQIRDQFDCDALGMQIDKLYLEYTTRKFREPRTVTQNLDLDSWTETHAALCDGNNDDFLFLVGFFATDDEEEYG